jgi:hypothetical protein
MAIAPSGDDESKALKVKNCHANQSARRLDPERLQVGPQPAGGDEGAHSLQSAADRDHHRLRVQSPSRVCLRISNLVWSRQR